MKEIKLWSERGVPFSEIVKRIRERSMTDCVTAQQWLLEAMPDELMAGICHMADHLRSTSRILSFMPLDQIKQIEGAADPEAVKEIIALCVEAYVRASDQCFPKASNN